jgi:hypothetical protein
LSVNHNREGEVTMPIDRYTKTVLTIIAGALLWLCVVGLPATVTADAPTHVIIDGWMGSNTPGGRPEPHINLTYTPIPVTATR